MSPATSTGLSPIISEHQSAATRPHMTANRGYGVSMLGCPGHWRDTVNCTFPAQNGRVIRGYASDRLSGYPTTDREMGRITRSLVPGQLSGHASTGLLKPFGVNKTHTRVTGGFHGEINHQRNLGLGRANYLQRPESLPHYVGHTRHARHASNSLGCFVP